MAMYFTLSSVACHQKAAIADLRLLHVVLGSVKQVMAYIGIAIATDYKITSFPA